MYNFLHFNNLIYRKQSGFLLGHSTTYQLIDIYNQICKAFDTTCMVFCDISKTLDRVWHKGLIHKVHQYSINKNLLNWLNNYLCNRTQTGFVWSDFSSPKPLKTGVPQGSVFGPLLFLIYVNDIADSLLSVTRLFADDISLAISSKDITHIESTLNKDLNELNLGSKQWLINFNPAKTEVLFLCLARRNKPNLIFNDTPFSFVDHHKHLDVTFSSDGPWHKHITNIASTAS